MRPNVEPGPLPHIIPPGLTNIMSVGVSEKGFQVGLVVPQIDPHDFGVHGISHRT
jgi:hypothetical protein